MRKLSAAWMTSLSLVFLLSIFVGPAMADQLDQFRKSGDVIERFDGLLEAAPNAPPAAQNLVRSVNAKRRNLYINRASKEGVPATEVAKVYAQQIYASAPKGTKFRTPDGRIVQK